MKVERNKLFQFWVNGVNLADNLFQRVLLTISITEAEAVFQGLDEGKVWNVTALGQTAALQELQRLFIEAATELVEQSTFAEAGFSLYSDELTLLLQRLVKTFLECIELFIPPRIGGEALLIGRLNATLKHRLAHHLIRSNLLSILFQLDWAAILCLKERCCQMLTLGTHKDSTRLSPDGQPVSPQRYIPGDSVILISPVQSIGYHQACVDAGAQAYSLPG